MTDRELREIKRRLRPEKCNVSRIVGCFVNTSGQILYKISQSLTLGDDSVNERLLGVMRKSLTGTLGSTITSIDYSTHAVSESPEHALLMRLRSSSLADTEALDELYSKITASLKLDTNYVILLMNDVYDVFTKSSDGESADSTEVFSYIIAAICPVKEPPEALTFREADSLFHPSGSQGILTSPELGFMFPAFDDRKTNIYGALYYTRSATESYGDFATSVLGAKPPIPRAVQRETFNTTVSEALAEECTLDVVRGIHSAVSEMIEAHKESRDPEPLTLTKYTMKDILTSAGVEGESLERIGNAIDESFGKGAVLTPKNVVSEKKFELKMPEVKISVDPEHRDLISTRKVNGERCVVIRITGPVEINGITINTDTE